MLFKRNDPALARFISADSVVPGSASGSMDGVALKPLTVDFHEPGLLARLHVEPGDDKLYWGGPLNPQALNRYSYVQNRPINATDPSGHSWYLGQQEANHLIQAFTRLKNDSYFQSWIMGSTGGVAEGVAGLGAAAAAETAVLLGVPLFAAFSAIAATLFTFGYTLDNIISYLTEFNGPNGLTIATDASSVGLYIADRATGEGVYYQPGVTMQRVFWRLPRSLQLGAAPVVLDKQGGWTSWYKGYHWKADERWIPKSTVRNSRRPTVVYPLDRVPKQTTQPQQTIR